MMFPTFSYRYRPIIGVKYYYFRYSVLSDVSFNINAFLPLFSYSDKEGSNMNTYIYGLLKMHVLYNVYIYKFTFYVNNESPEL